MGRAPCCSKVGLQRGPWTANEDELLIKYIQDHGEGQWRSLPKKAGLLRCGKSCRLRWMNYLRPDIKRGNITSEEDGLIIRLHGLLGNRWSLIAGRLPGRTDNEIKNYWNTHLSKRLRSQGTDPNTHKKLSESELEKQAMNYNKKKCRRSSINNKNHTRITKIHLPKPVRAKSIISLASNNSNISLESSNLSTTSASSSQNQTLSQTLNQNHGLTTTFNNNNNNNNSNSSSILDMPWLSNNNASMESNGIDDQLMMTIGQSFDNHEVSLDAMKIHDNNQVPENNNNNNQQLEKLYEEYLQLIKVDDDDDVDDVMM